MAVTGIATSGRGYNKKIATSSLDQTCKVHKLKFLNLHVHVFLDLRLCLWFNYLHISI